MAPWPPAVFCSSSAILAIDILYAGILLFVLFMATGVCIDVCIIYDTKQV